MLGVILASAIFMSCAVEVVAGGCACNYGDNPPAGANPRTGCDGRGCAYNTGGYAAGRLDGGAYNYCDHANPGGAAGDCFVYCCLLPTAD